jgi:TonB family protein
MRATPIAIFALLLSVSGPCIAQQEPCGLCKMTETTAPFYPPIAKAARVEGTVILLVTFATSGEVEKIETVKAPKILESPARTYVQGWRANQYTGPRTCPIVISYRLFPEGDKTPLTAIRSDLQHVRISSPPPPPLYSSYSMQGSK